LSKKRKIENNKETTLKTFLSQLLIKSKIGETMGLETGSHEQSGESFLGLLIFVYGTTPPIAPP